MGPEDIRDELERDHGGYDDDGFGIGFTAGEWARGIAEHNQRQATVKQQRDERRREVINEVTTQRRRDDQMKRYFALAPQEND